MAYSHSPDEGLLIVNQPIDHINCHPHIISFTHPLTRRVVEDGSDGNIEVTPALDGFVEHPDGVLTHSAWTVETLGPRHEQSHVQALLGHRKGEGEACREGIKRK